MCRWTAVIISLMILASPCAKADDFDYYWPWIKANITNSSLIAANSATNIYLLAPGPTGYVSKISAHVYGISIPTNTLYGSNAWAWVVSHSNALNVASNTAAWASNNVSSISNYLASAGGTSYWNQAYIIASWASNNTAGISNLVYNLPTNDWNWGTNLSVSISNFLESATGAWNTAIAGGSNVALWASNNVTSISNFLYSVTNDWNWATNVVLWSSNTAYMVSNLLASTGGTDYWNQAHVIAEWASNNVGVAGFSTNAMSGIWGLSMAGELTPLVYVQAYEAGLWRVNTDGSVTPSGNDWYDTLWTTNSEGDLTPR